MEGELRAFDAHLRPIGTIVPVKGLKVAWQRNQASGGSFTIPRDSLRWSATYVRHLHRVEYHHPLLPTWVGTIVEHDPHEADVDITCLSGEWLYEKRLTDEWVQLIGSGGTLVRTLHDQAQRRAPLHIEMGALDMTGPEYYLEYELKPVADALSDVATQTGGDWWVEKVGHRHQDPWCLRWARQRGRDRSGQVVLAGEVVDQPSYKTSATDMLTAAWVLGGGTGSELWQRIHFPLDNRAAQRVYGFLEGTAEFKDAIDMTLLRESGIRALAQSSTITRTLGVNIDNRRGSWGTFWIGDTIRLLLPGVDYLGLDTLAVVQGIELDVDTGRMGLVLEVG